MINFDELIIKTEYLSYDCQILVAIMQEPIGYATYFIYAINFNQDKTYYFVKTNFDKLQEMLDGKLDIRDFLLHNESIVKVWAVNDFDGEVEEFVIPECLLDKNSLLPKEGIRWKQYEEKMAEFSRGNVNSSE